MQWVVNYFLFSPSSLSQNYFLFLPVPRMGSHFITAVSRELDGIRMGAPSLIASWFPQATSSKAANNEPFPNDKTSFSTTIPVRAPFFSFLSISLSFSDSPIAGRNDNKFVCDCVISLIFRLTLCRAYARGTPTEHAPGTRTTTIRLELENFIRPFVFFAPSCWTWFCTFLSLL